MKSLIFILLFSFSAQAQNIVVAELDTGVDISHEALKSHIYVQEQQIQSYDFTTNFWKTPDLDGHGTGIAGLIVGLEKPTPFIKLLPLKFTRHGFPNAWETEQYLKALDLAIKMKVDIINISFVHNRIFPAEERLLTQASKNNIWVVVAAGNEHLNLDKTPQYPCSYNLANVICVGNQNGKVRHPHSNFGTLVRVWVQGTNLVTTAPNQGVEVVTGSSESAAKFSHHLAVIKHNYPSLKKEALLKKAFSL